MRQAQALGDRLRRPDLERSVITGSLSGTDGTGLRVRITLEPPAWIAIEPVEASSGASLAFDGQRIGGAGIPGLYDEDVLETILTDLAEGMFYTIQRGAALQILGRGFRPNPALFPDYKGPLYDIYEVTAPVLVRRLQNSRTKRYYFDSKTGLLASTRYQDDRQRLIETRVTDWREAFGSMYPTKIERYESSRLIFALQIQEVTAAARALPVSIPRTIGSAR
jgi:hypothetical protein